MTITKWANGILTLRSRIFYGFLNLSLACVDYIYCYQRINAGASWFVDRQMSIVRAMAKIRGGTKSFSRNPFFSRCRLQFFLKRKNLPARNKALAKRSRQSTHVRKCELANGGQTESQVHASSTQATRKPFQCSLTRAPVQRKTIRPTCIDLSWVAKR